MADQTGNAGASRSAAPTKRARAPTITIDTSAVAQSPENPNEGNQPFPDHTNLSQMSPTDLRPSNSFENSRPTSPHNAFSPQWSDRQNLLAVPMPRSRASSIESESGQSTSSGTYVNSAPSDHGKPKAFDGGDKAHEILKPEEALRPDPGTEADFQRENNPFAFTPGQLGKLLNPKNYGAFKALGGLSGIEKGLRSDRKSGLSSEEVKVDGQVTFEDATGAPNPSQTSQSAAAGSNDGGSRGTQGYEDRQRVFNDNRLPERKAKGILQLAWMAYNDKVLLLLTAAAVVSLALGLYQTFGTEHRPGQPKIEWVEGVAIIVAIVIVVFVGALNDWQKERQFVKLNRKKEARQVKVVRSGRTQEISIYDIMVGEVVLLEPGDLVPVDGIFISGHGIKCDESSATGESDLLKKTPADEVSRAIEAGEPLKKLDPFILSGSKITEGVGSFMVTAVGVNSTYGKTMMSLREDNDPTPLQSKLNVLAEYIAKLGGAAALLLFVVLFIKFLAQLRNNHSTPSAKAQDFLQIFIVAVTIVVVAVPEGLPLAVTLALAFATKQMTKDNNLVRVLRSCETMGNATSICSDKTGTLTQNVMTVVAGSIGTSSRFANPSAGTSSTKDSPDDMVNGADQLDDVAPAEFLQSLSETVKSSWKDAIAINSTAFEGEDNGFIGSKTETALLKFARDNLGMEKVQVERSNAEIVQLIPFDSGRKCMAVVVRISQNKYRLYVKGASEIMLNHCTRLIRDPTKSLDDISMSKDNSTALEHMIETYASRSLRTIGFIFRDFESWPPRGARKQEDDKTQAVFEDVLKEMTFFGLVGIQDPLRPGVAEAVLDCKSAGVFVRMVTGDNIMTAKAIAKECGIWTAGGVVLEGPEFRKMSKQMQREVIPKLQVLARSSPEDKRILVKRLKEMGETVAVTGDGTNDAPALKAADVGFSMGIAGTEVAKEASDIILMDDNFASIVKALMWGRAVNDAVRKFLQFQITVNITAVLLAFVSAVANPNEESVLTAVQLLWVNLIMDTFAALALATDPPTRNILNRKPDPKSAPLITVNMWKMIIGQAIYQLTVTFVLYFAGASILSYQSEREKEQVPTLVFNTFVWMQIFNEFNNRRLDNGFNIFEGVFRNWFFIGINIIMIGGQILIIFVGGAAFSVKPLNGAQWAYSLVLGAFSIPVGMIIRLIPDDLVGRMVPGWLQRKSSPQVVVNDEEQPFEFNQGMMDIKHELAWIKKYKGGRLNNLKFKLQHPREAFLHSRSHSQISLPSTPNLEGNESDYGFGAPSPATPDSRRKSRGRSRSNSAIAGAAMAGIIAGSIAGWSPMERNLGEGDNADRGRSRNDLVKDHGLQVHPQTREGEELFVQNPVMAAGNNAPSQSQETTPAMGTGPFAEPAPSSQGKAAEAGKGPQFTTRERSPA